MFNPFEHMGPNLSNSATRLVLITPDDANDLVRAIKALRINNPNGSPADVTITTSGGDTVTVTVPATSLWIEPAVITRVWLTGTTAGLTLHGYTD